MVRKLCGLLRCKIWLTKLISLAIIIVFLLSGLSLSSREASASPSATKKVLILSPFNADFPFYVKFVQGIKQRIAENNTADFYYFQESLGLWGFSLEDSFFEQLATVLRQKYANNRPDIIIVYSEPATRFFVQYGSAIFGDTPAILVSFTYEQEASNYHGLPEKHTLLAPFVPIENTAQLILDLKPATKKIYVVFGSSDIEQKIYEYEKPRIEAFKNRVEINFLNQLAFQDMLEYISEINGDAAVLFWYFQKDVIGNTYVPAEVMQAICAVSSVPVFGSMESFLGTGALGGYMLNATYVAQQVADKALNTLQGTKGGNKVERVDLGSYIFDWRALKRWNIDERRLPSGSIIQYRPTSFWYLYKWYIIGGLLLILLQSTLITLLLINRRKRKRAERELERLDLLHLIGEMAAGISHEVRNPLTTVRGYLQLLSRKHRYSSDLETVKLMVDELDRANYIISEYLSLAKNKAIEPKKNCVNSIVQSLLPILKAEATLRGQSVVLCAGNVPDVVCDEKEVRQVILNLVKNGLEAMGEKGVITIKTSTDKNSVILSVNDIGPGIPKEIRAKIGIPFFTTKGQGTGLGLSVCFAIAERHGGRIMFESNDAGTTFYLILPIQKEV